MNYDNEQSITTETCVSLVMPRLAQLYLCYVKNR